MSKPFAGSFRLYRQTKPKARWKVPGVPVYDPSWVVVISMPGAEPDKAMRPHLPLCEVCLSVAENPAVTRPNCACVKAAQTWAKEELVTRTHLLQAGRLNELRALRAPEKLTPLHEVLKVYVERGPADAAKRRNSLRSIWTQATGKEFEVMAWKDLTRGLFLDWAEIRQEAGRRGWLGVGSKKMPEDGWSQLRELREAGQIPSLDRRNAASWNVTIMGYLVNVKSMFNADARQHVLRGLTLPSLKEFLETTLDLPIEKGHRAIAADAWVKMLEAEPALEIENPRLWVVHELLLRLSCRPIEIQHARPSWLEKVEGRTRIIIKNRPEEGFSVKARANATDRAIWLPEKLVRAIEGVATETSLIGAKHVTEARHLIYYQHSEWMKRFLPEGSTKTSYLLRHFGAAERMTSGDATEAAALLGHSSTKLVESTYGKRLDTQEPISDDEILRRVA